MPNVLQNLSRPGVLRFGTAAINAARHGNQERSSNPEPQAHARKVIALSRDLSENPPHRADHLAHLYL